MGHTKYSSTYKLIHKHRYIHTHIGFDILFVWNWTLQTKAGKTDMKFPWVDANKWMNRVWTMNVYVHVYMFYFAQLVFPLHETSIVCLPSKLGYIVCSLYSFHFISFQFSHVLCCSPVAGEKMNSKPNVVATSFRDDGVSISAYQIIGICFASLIGDLCLGIRHFSSITI